MESKIQKTSALPTERLNNKEIKIAQEIYEVNQLAPYPLSSIQIEDWSRSINRLMPDLEVSKLESLINDFKLDNIEWDYKKGIQNIFIGLKSYTPTMKY